MNDATPQTAPPNAAPTPLIHVAGNLFVRLDSNPLHGLSRILNAQLADSLAAADRAIRDDMPGPNIAVHDEQAPLKVMADGSRIDAREPATDHVAVLFPDTGWMIAVNALSRAGKPFSSQQDVATAAAALTLLGHDDWSLAPDKVYERHVIDRRYHAPAADKNLFPNLPLNDWYWTSTVAPWSAESAFGVLLHDGSVNDLRRVSSGFGLACRRARQ